MTSRRNTLVTSTTHSRHSCSTWRVQLPWTDTMDRLLRLLVSIRESKWGVDGAGTDDDGLPERLSRRYTSTLLAAFAMIVTTHQFVGEPISCWCPTYFTDSQRQYTNNVCWISNTFYVPLPVSIVKCNGPLRRMLDHFPCICWCLYSLYSRIQSPNIRYRYVILSWWQKFTHLLFLFFSLLGRPLHKKPKPLSFQVGRQDEIL